MIGGMDALASLFEKIDVLRNSPEIIMFAEDNLLRFVYVGLAFGFSILLVEMRLPLKYYWDLPTYILRRLFSSVGLVKKDPVWGRCLEKFTERPVPLAAIEILDADSRETIKISFSSRLGEYGFRVKPGKFIIRAVKNHYLAPPIFDPENIRLKSVDESFALPVDVKSGEWPKNVDLLLQFLNATDLKKPTHAFAFFFRAFVLALGNGFLTLSVIGSWYGWVVLETPVYGVLMAVGIVFLFIKIYILEAVGSASSNKK